MATQVDYAPQDALLVMHMLNDFCEGRIGTGVEVQT